MADYITGREAAEQLRVGRPKIQALVRAGRLETDVVDGRRRIRADAPARYRARVADAYAALDKISELKRQRDWTIARVEGELDDAIGEARGIEPLTATLAVIGQRLGVTNQAIYHRIRKRRIGA
jgi:excisionase family DNA binding protein